MTSDEPEDMADIFAALPEAECEPKDIPLEHLDDIRLSISLLAGTSVRKNGKTTKVYLDEDAELVSRKALVRLLRDDRPLDMTVRRLLAALIDPEPEVAPYSSFDAAPVEQRLDLVGRHKGGAKIQNLRKIEMGLALQALLRAEPTKKLPEATEEIADRYAVSARTIESAGAFLKTILAASR